MTEVSPQWQIWGMNETCINCSSEEGIKEFLGTSSENFYGIIIFSCPEQLNRWPCHSLRHSLRVLLLFGIKEPQFLTILTILTIMTIFYNFWQFWQFLIILTILTILTIFDNSDNWELLLPFWQLKRQSWRLVTLITILTIENFIKEDKDKVWQDRALLVLKFEGCWNIDFQVFLQLRCHWDVSHL